MSTLQVLTSFPTAIPSVLLIILLIYWIVSFAGLVDMGDNLEIHSGEVGHGHADHTDHADHDSADIHTLASYLVALGLGGVPFSVVASLLVFFTWFSTALLQQYALVLVPTDVLKLVFGISVLVASAVLSIPITSALLKPMRGLFVKHHARSNASLVGLNCCIVTQTVDEKFGRAHVEGSGLSLNIRVWAATPNTLKKGSTAVIMFYDEVTQQYEVQELPDHD